MGLSAAVNRLDDIRALGVETLHLSQLPSGRLDALARQGYSVRAQAIERMHEDRQLATWVARARDLEVRALDDVLDLFGVLVAELLSKSHGQERRRRLRTLKDLDHAALLLCEAYQSLLTPEGTGSVEVARNALFERIPASNLADASHTVKSLAQPKQGRHYQDFLQRYRTARRILLTLLESVDFKANVAGHPIVEALSTIDKRRDARQTLWKTSDVPLEFVTSAWRRWVCPNGDEVDRRAYTLCALEGRCDAWVRHDIFVENTRHWVDPRAQLISGYDGETSRPRICRMLRLSPVVDDEIALFRVELDQAYHRTAAGFDDNPAIRFEPQEGRDELVITPLDALDEPPSLVQLRDAIEKRMPRADLADVLLEVDAWTGFSQSFSHVSEGRARVDELSTSVCAVLIAEARNLGFEPITQASVPALTRGRLSWVAQNYLRGETISAANARLVDYHATLPLVARWGGGDVASADGLRFVVPLRTINAGPNPRYFGTGRGVTYLNFISDQYAGFSGLVIPGTLRDSVYILEGLLQNDTSLRPVQIMTDTASYSDLVFGLFRLLGYQFSPRLADAGSARFWRVDAHADCGSLNELGKHVLRLGLIRDNWDDMLRVAGSLAGGNSNAIELVRALQGGGRPTTLGRAIAEYGRVPKTLHLLQVLNAEPRTSANNYRDSGAGCWASRTSRSSVPG